MGRLRTEFEVTCPCCQSTLVVDEGLQRVVRHVEPERPDKPKLDEAHQILADEKARREALFEKSVQSEKNRGDALSKRFEDALKQAREQTAGQIFIAHGNRPDTGGTDVFHDLHEMGAVDGVGNIAPGGIARDVTCMSSQIGGSAQRVDRYAAHGAFG